MKNKIVKSLLLVLLISSMMERVAFAYIDPSTGGMLFQMLATLLALLSGVALVFSRQVRMLFARAMRSLRRVFGRDNPQTEDSRAQPQHTDE